MCEKSKLVSKVMKMEMRVPTFYSFAELPSVDGSVRFVVTVDCFLGRKKYIMTLSKKSGLVLQKLSDAMSDRSPPR